jgi:hypothetical protein
MMRYGSPREFDPPFFHSNRLMSGWMDKFMKNKAQSGGEAATNLPKIDLTRVGNKRVGPKSGVG